MLVKKNMLCDKDRLHVRERREKKCRATLKKLVAKRKVQYLYASYRTSKGNDRMRTKVLLCAASIILAACGEQKNTSVSNVRMVNASMGEGPWQVVTYKGDRVTRDTVVLDDGEVSIRSASVYVNNKSQFVLMDGTPITIFTGDKIYWNAEGQVITSKMKRVQEYLVFSVNGDPVAKNTALTLFDYSPVRDNKL